MGNSSIAMSWIQYDADTDFPIQNVPYGVFVPAGSDQARCGVRVGDTVVDLAAIESELPASVAGAFGQPSLNQFMSLGAAVWRPVPGLLSFSQPTKVLRNLLALCTKPTPSL